MEARNAHILLPCRSYTRLLLTENLVEFTSATDSEIPLLIHMKVSQLLLTIYPSDANCLQNGEEDQWDSAAGVVVKELKHIESCLQSTRSKTQRSVDTR